MYYPPCDPNTLYHYGVKGMKWGVRRYYNDEHYCGRSTYRGIHGETDQQLCRRNERLSEKVVRDRR